jgi:transcriptional regulator with XRE-family HTH domain
VKSLGEFIRELRQERDVSLRELARELDISAPFLSDIELGKRYPSLEVLTKLAKRFKVSVDELQKYDNRESIADLKKLMDGNASWGFAFRTMADKAKEGKISPEELLKKIRGTG